MELRANRKKIENEGLRIKGYSVGLTDEMWTAIKNLRPYSYTSYIRGVLEKDPGIIAEIKRMRGENG